MNALTSALAAAVILGGQLHAAAPAFPGAEGFGAVAAGGRGGRVIEVTNLNDAGPGSFRAAIEAEGPRTVVFRVGGTIELMTEVVLAHPFITIAGQTAPGGGITLKTHPSNTRSALTVTKGCHDVIIRHLRSRPGPHEGFPPLRNGREPDTSEVKDALQILGARRVIVDHCSFSWATDEVVSTFYDAQDITLQWCIIAEALRKSRPDQSLPGKGLLIGSKGGRRISVHHNLMAHNVGRNPLIKAEGIVDVVNNVVLAPAMVAMAIDAELGHSPANFTGNHVSAPAADGLANGLAVLGGGAFSLFVKDNLGPKRLRADQPEELFVNAANQGRKWLVPARHDAPPITTHAAADVWEAVLANAGCLLPMRDAVDERIIAEVRQNQPRIVDSPAQVGGWPELAPGTPPPDRDHDGMTDDWETRHGFNPDDPADGNLDADDDGYTNLEEFLNGTDPAQREAP